jgi:hypothetical protein
LTGAELAIGSARAACAASDTKTTRRRLAQAATRLQRFVKRVRSKAVRRTVPVGLRTEIGETGESLREDAKTLRSTPECPADAA